MGFQTGMGFQTWGWDSSEGMRFLDMGMGFQTVEGVPVRGGVPDKGWGSKLGWGSRHGDGVSDKGWDSRHGDGVPDSGMWFQTQVGFQTWDDWVPDK